MEHIGDSALVVSHLVNYVLRCIETDVGLLCHILSRVSSGCCDALSGSAAVPPCHTEKVCPDLNVDHDDLSRMPYRWNSLTF